MKRMSKQRPERISFVNLGDICDVSVAAIGVLTGKDRGGAAGHGRRGCCPSAEGAPSKLESSILSSKTLHKSNSKVSEFKTAQDMIFALKQVSFVDCCFAFCTTFRPLF